MEINWKKIYKIHFIGIKGVAMAALAVWAKEAGYNVTGSDVMDSFPTDDVLRKADIQVMDFDPKNIVHVKPNLVLYTGAHGGRDNPEVVESEAFNIPTMPHGKALGRIMARSRQVSIAGSHGKTTTTAMIATILSHAGQDPSWTIGCGEIRGLGLPGHHGKGNIFIAEADEYVTDPGHDSTPRFLWQNPDVLVVTNIDWDHPDVYKSLGDVQDAFARLQSQQKGSRITVVNADDKASAGLLQQKSSTIVTYGFSPKAEFHVSDVRFGSERTFFTLSQHGMKVSDFVLKVPGRHNALNGAAAAVVCRNLGVSWEQIASGLVQFAGTKRRFELVGIIGETLVYDDYAHHPNEIKATLTAAKEWYPDRRIIAVFQPHTYSRTYALLSQFARAFGNADEILLADIYASAREADTLGISGRTLVEEAAKHHRNVYYTPDYSSVAKRLRATIQPGDVIIFMGAGDIYGWSRAFV